MRGRTVAVLAALALTVAVAGCAADTPVRPLDPAGASTGPIADSPAGTPRPAAQNLTSRRAELGIAACPTPSPAPPAASTPSADAGAGKAGVDRLPDVVTRCLDGSADVSVAALTGTPMVINLWATWCGPCRQEAPYLAEVSAGAGPGVRFLGVDVADPDAEAAMEFAAASGWHYPQVADPDRRLTAELGIAGLPQTLIVGSDGTILARHAGPIGSADELRDLIGQHLG